MLRDFLSSFLLLIALAGCPGGSGVGDSCGGNDDCDSSLQCLNRRCIRQCARAPECGDGYRCENKHCIAASGQAGDPCESEVDCAAGLSCQINGVDVTVENRLAASCTVQNATGNAGEACEVDGDCRNGTCELGHCVDLCKVSDDCLLGSFCGTVPRVAANGALFAGCLPSQGTLTWSIPVTSPSAEVLLPIPFHAASAELVMTVADPGERVGAVRVLDSSGFTLFGSCVGTPPGTPCTTTQTRDKYFSSVVRHLPGFGQSVLLMPSVPLPDLQIGTYRIRVESSWPSGALGAAVPHVQAVVQMGSGNTLELHFFFLELDQHPCADRTDGATLDAAHAQTAGFFQDTFLSGLKAVYSRMGIAVEAASYEDIHGRPGLDALDVASAGDLLSLGRYSTGINVFFVRSLSPIGTQAYAPNPGPAGVGGTAQSGIVLALDTLCYRDWQDVARLLAHQIARYMGLYHNVEIDYAAHPTWRDPIQDSDDSNDNLMYFSEHLGTTLSVGQRELLLRSAVLVQR